MTFVSQKPRRCSATVACVLVASMLALLPTVAVAQVSVPDGGSTSTAPTIVYTPMRPIPTPIQPRASRPVPSPFPRPSMSAAQIDDLAEFFQAQAEEVSQRLWMDPGLAPLALKALEARHHRRSRGTAMTAWGWIIFGVGTAVGAVIFLQGDLQSRPLLWSTCDSACQRSSSNKENTGAVVALVSTVIGLGLALPGMTTLRKQSDEEDQALRRYQGVNNDHLSVLPCPSLPSAPAAFTRNARSLPLLGFSF